MSSRSRRRRRQRPVRLEAIFAAVVSIAAVVLGTSALVHYESEAAPGADRPGAVFPKPKQPDYTVVMVLGDSYTSGSTMNAGSPTWAPLLASQRGWVLDSDAVSATGYVSAKQGHQPFPVRAKADVAKYTPDLVLLAGGLNDWMMNQKQVVAKAKQTIDTLRSALPGTDIVLLSPFGGTPENGHLKPEVAIEVQNLKRLAQQERVPFIDVSTVLMGANTKYLGVDDLHPTGAGHALLAAHIGAALDKLGLPRPHAYKTPAPAASASVASSS